MELKWRQMVVEYDALEKEIYDGWQARIRHMVELRQIIGGVA
mgnify:CR=1 FL=1